MDHERSPASLRTRSFAVATMLAGLAASVALPAAAATTAEIEPRILAQEGLAVALASNVLQSQLQVLFHVVGNSTTCSALTGGGSVLVTSIQKVSKTVTDAKVTVYFDTKCKVPYIDAVAKVTTSLAGYSVTETASYLDSNGHALGTLTLSETATGTKTDLVLIGLGKFALASGAQIVDLGLTCTIPTVVGSKSINCEGGVAQDFPKLKLSLASVTPLTLTAKTGNSVGFVGTASDMQTGAPGSLSITTPTGSSLGIGGAGTPYGSTATNGFAAKFSLFPPTPTHWTITDKAHDAKFSLKVLSNTTRASAATVTTISSKAVLASLHVDESGTGTITYADGSKAAVTSWLLAD